MALTAALAAAAVVGAGTGVYGAMQGGRAQSAANRSNAQAIAENRRQNTQNATIDLLNTLRNAQQQAIDNQRYDEAKQIEDAQRQLVNRIATASQQDANGNTVSFDPVTGTWRVTNTGIGAANVDRTNTLQAQQYTGALEGATRGAQGDRDRSIQGGIAQSRERALGQELLARYSNNQGRTPGQLEGALIERNVAEAVDPLRTGGEMAMLSGYRQGNSGNDALLGALARQGQGATRSAIASARLDAPSTAFNERDMAAKSVLGPSTTLTSRGTAAPDSPAPVFSGDASSNLLASIARGNAAGVGTTLNPRSGQQAPVQLRSGANTGFQPLNAAGNQWAGVSESLTSLLRSPEIRNTLSSWFGSPATKPPAAAPVTTKW